MRFWASIEIGGKDCANVWMGVGKKRYIKKSRAQLPVKVVAPLLN